MNDTDTSGSISNEPDTSLGHKEHSMTDSDEKIIWMTPEVEGKRLKMELDTRSALLLISLKEYKEKFAKLKQTPVLLKTYTGDKVAYVGKMKYECKRKILDLYVLNLGGVPLFRRENTNDPAQLAF